MTKKLEEIFGFDKIDGEDITPSENTLPPEETRQAIQVIDSNIDKIDAALPAIRDLDTSDAELDDIARMAVTSYKDLTDLGMNVDARFSGELFAVASTMLNTALSAKTTKINKKLKMIDLQLKKLKLDQDRKEDGPAGETHTAQGQILTRNDLLERLINSRTEQNKK